MRTAIQQQHEGPVKLGKRGRDWFAAVEGHDEDDATSLHYRYPRLMELLCGDGGGGSGDGGRGYNLGTPYSKKSCKHALNGFWDLEPFLPPPFLPPPFPLSPSSSIDFTTIDISFYDFDTTLCTPYSKKARKHAKNRFSDLEPFPPPSFPLSPPSPIDFTTVDISLYDFDTTIPLPSPCPCPSSSDATTSPPSQDSVDRNEQDDIDELDYILNLFMT